MNRNKFFTHPLPTPPALRNKQGSATFALSYKFSSLYRFFRSRNRQRAKILHERATKPAKIGKEKIIGSGSFVALVISERPG